MLFVTEDIPYKLIYEKLNGCFVALTSLALHSSHYENFIIIGDFNEEANDNAISVFSDTYGLESFIKESTSYKNPNKTFLR